MHCSTLSPKMEAPLDRVAHMKLGDPGISLCLYLLYNIAFSCASNKPIMELDVCVYRDLQMFRCYINQLKVSGMLT